MASRALSVCKTIPGAQLAESTRLREGGTSLSVWAKLLLKWMPLPEAGAVYLMTTVASSIGSREASERTTFGRLISSSGSSSLCSSRSYSLALSSAILGAISAALLPSRWPIVRVRLRKDNLTAANIPRRVTNCQLSALKKQLPASSNAGACSGG